MEKHATSSPASVLRMETPHPFCFRDVVRSHGWVGLPPYSWDDEGGVLSRVHRLPSGQVIEMRLWSEAGTLCLETDADPGSAAGVADAARWILALDADLTGFHALCREEPGLHRAGERGHGRMLRSPTAWEDVVKTLFSVNTTWRQTVAMTRHLTELCGDRHASGAAAFPTPEAVARVSPEELQARCRTGYRAAFVSDLARGVVEGRIDLERLKRPDLSAETVESELRSLRGVGPYAAANVLMLLGHYDYLPVDSWLRSTVRRHWFGGQEASDRELVAAFERFRPYRALAYHCYDWRGTACSETAS